MALTFERTFDYELVRRIVTHEKIWPHVSDDGTVPASEWRPIEHAAFLYVLVKEERSSSASAPDDAELLGLFMFTPQNAVCYEVHTCLLPNAWGARAKAAARGMSEWMFTHTNCRRIVTTVPAYNRLALRFAERAGMSLFGTNPQSIQKHGELQDQFLLGISKCQQP